MSDLKFTCSSCAQHIRCDESYANERIPCPHCGTVVRVPADAPRVSDDSTPTAAPNVPAAASTLTVPTLEENFANDSAPVATPPPITEREQQIAAARAAHPVGAIAAVKPRLSYILSGGQAPVAKENESALPPEPHAPAHSKSLSE